MLGRCSVHQEVVLVDEEAAVHNEVVVARLDVVQGQVAVVDGAADEAHDVGSFEGRDSHVKSFHMDDCDVHVRW